jgi:Holliday junction resolvase
MSMTPEKKVKVKVTAKLKVLGAYNFAPVTSGYGSSGWPDIVGCYKGRFLGIECKAGKNKPTQLQEYVLENIRVAGGIALVINEHNVDQLIPLIEAEMKTEDLRRYIAEKNKQIAQLDLQYGDKRPAWVNEQLQQLRFYRDDAQQELDKLGETK